MSQFKLAFGVGGVPPHENAVAYRWEHRLRWLMAACVASVCVGEDGKRLRREMNRDILELRADVARMVDDEIAILRTELGRVLDARAGRN